VLQVKLLVLQAVREAFHYALEQFIMGETQVGEFEEFRVSFRLKHLDGDAGGAESVGAGGRRAPLE